MDVLSLSLCHIVVVVIMFTCEHVSHRSGGESNPDRSDESTEYNPLHCASTVHREIMKPKLHLAGSSKLNQLHFEVKIFDQKMMHSTT